MTELTPELEALYALHRNVPRSELSMAAQLEYDRLRPAWERGDARPAAGELEAARLAWEQEYRPKHDTGPAIRYAVDRSGTAHTFRYRRGFHLFWGTPVVVIGVGLLVGLAAALAYPSSSWARGDGGAGTSGNIWMAALGLLLIWLGIRLLRVGVLQVSAGKMRVRGYFRTRAVEASEVRAITLLPKDVGGERSCLRWRARVTLTGGKGFWIDGFDGGRAEKKPPNPEVTAALDEVRALLGVRADDIGQPATRLTQDGRAATPVSVRQQPLESAPDPDVDGFILAGWVETREFSTTRLRPGYDIEQVDGFLSAIRDTFLDIRGPSLTPEEIRVKQFTITRLRPGYDQLEVDAVLDKAESRLAAQDSARRSAPAAEPESVTADPAAEAVHIRCLECGAESADAAQVCPRCGAPAPLSSIRQGLDAKAWLTCGNAS
jgi:DivIVA domain-containing protein